MKSCYMIVIDASFSRPYDLHELITKHPGTISWWHYLTSCYIIVTTTGLHQMQDLMHEKFPADRFMLIDINPRHKGGWLQNAAWEWFDQFRTWTMSFTSD